MNLHPDGTPLLHPFGSDGPPNLDDFSADCEDFRAVAHVFRDYAHYLEIKAIAVKHRAKGNLSLAEMHEDNLQKLYANLPEWARW